jgi:hypothetical protein
MRFMTYDSIHSDETAFTYGRGISRKYGADDHRVAHEDGTISDRHSSSMRDELLASSRSAMKNAIDPEFRPRLDRYIRANGHARSNDHEFANSGTRTYDCGRVHDGCRVDPNAHSDDGRGFGLRFILQQFFMDSIKTITRIWRDYDTDVARDALSEFRSHDHRCHARIAERAIEVMCVDRENKEG